MGKSDSKNLKGKGASTPSPSGRSAPLTRTCFYCKRPYNAPSHERLDERRRVHLERCSAAKEMKTRSAGKEGNAKGKARAKTKAQAKAKAKAQSQRKKATSGQRQRSRKPAVQVDSEVGPSLQRLRDEREDLRYFPNASAPSAEPWASTIAPQADRDRCELTQGNLDTYARENGRLGSSPVSDDYGSESDP